MPIIAGIAALLGGGGSLITGIGTILGVAFLLLRIKALIAIIMAAMWFLVAYFAKELFGWGLDVFFSLVGSVLSVFGIEDPTDRVIGLLQQLPPILHQLWSRLHVYSRLQEITQAYAINWALSSIPIIGRLFKSG